MVVFSRVIGHSLMTRSNETLRASWRANVRLSGKNHPGKGVDQRSESSSRPLGDTTLMTETASQERALPVSLLRAREAVMLHMRPILRAHGFTEQQWRVLRSLNAVTPMDKTTLASRATLLMPSLLRIVKDLETLGLLRAVPSQNNRRLTRIILTSKGAATVERGSKDLARMGHVVRDQIGGEDFDELIRLLNLAEARLIQLRTQSAS
jgi:homoprotocatechuate degradation regulator HpaR